MYFPQLLRPARNPLVKILVNDMLNGGDARVMTRGWEGADTVACCTRYARQTARNVTQLLQPCHRVSLMPTLIATWLPIPCPDASSPKIRLTSTKIIV